MHRVVFLLVLSLFIFIDQVSAVNNGESIYAVNAGGPHHVGSDGIRYLADLTPSEERGSVSDYGLGSPIHNADSRDSVLYQTERYHTSSFSYSIPIKEEGDYALVLKFAEVYFDQAEQKVFDIHLNGITVISGLDIFKKAGKNTAYDEVLDFTVKDGVLSVGNAKTPFNGNALLSFVKIDGHDNPKICAFSVIKGGSRYVRGLNSILVEDFDDEEEIDIEDIEDVVKLSQSKISDPYSYDLSSLAPLIAAFGIFFASIYSLVSMNHSNKEKKR
eukprot:Sdes_comp15217_c0_seq1m4046